jgi:hypothetical protein
MWRIIFIWLRKCICIEAFSAKSLRVNKTRKNSQLIATRKSESTNKAVWVGRLKQGPLCFHHTVLSLALHIPAHTFTLNNFSRLNKTVSECTLNTVYIFILLLLREPEAATLLSAVYSGTLCISPHSPSSPKIQWNWFCVSPKSASTGGVSGRKGVCAPRDTRTKPSRSRREDLVTSSTAESYFAWINLLQLLNSHHVNDGKWHINLKQRKYNWVKLFRSSKQKGAHTQNFTPT